MWSIQSMVLEQLDVNDPQPRRDDPRFGSDYKRFRKADKAWNERERSRRAKLAKLAQGAERVRAGELAERTEWAEHAEHARHAEQAALAENRVSAASSAHPKPRGKVPKVGGVPCTWDAQSGCWLDAAGKEPDLMALRAAATLACAHRRKRAVRQRRREAAAALDDALMKSTEEAALHVGDGACTGSEMQQQPMQQEDVFVTSSSMICRNEMARYRRLAGYLAGHESFLSKVRELGGELARVIIEKPRKPKNKKQRLMRRSDAFRVRVRRGAAFWSAADSMYDRHSRGARAILQSFWFAAARTHCMLSAGEFRHHLRCLLQLKVDQLLEEHRDHCEALLRAEEQAAYDRHRAEWRQNTKVC